MRTIVYIGTSLDHFIARANGDIDWLIPYSTPDVFESYHQLINRIDCLLMGRHTFEKVVSFEPWPYSKKVFVLSNTLKQLPEHLKDKAEIINKAPKESLAYLASQGATAVYVDGGKLIQGLLQEDLIDELIISTLPVLIGSGIPLFGGMDRDLLFKHIKTQSFPNGLVMSFYERSKA